MAEHESSDKSTKAGLSPQTTAFWAAIIYAFAVLIVCGGAGIWLPAAMPSKTVTIDGLTTFVLATLAPMFVDLLIDAEIYGNKLTKFWRISFMAACFVAGALALVALVRENAQGDWLAGVAAVIMSILIWTALAVKLDRFLQPSSTTGSIGGKDPSTDQLAGKGL